MPALQSRRATGKDVSSAACATTTGRRHQSQHRPSDGLPLEMDAIAAHLSSPTQQLSHELAPELMPAVVAATVSGVDPFAPSSFPLPTASCGGASSSHTRGAEMHLLPVEITRVEDMWESSVTMADALAYTAGLPKGSAERRLACSVLLLRYLPSLERSSASDQAVGEPPVLTPFRNCSNSIMEERAFKLVGCACTAMLTPMHATAFHAAACDPPLPTSPNISFPKFSSSPLPPVSRGPV